MKLLKITQTAGTLSVLLLMGTAPALRGGIQHISAAPKGGIAPVPPVPVPRECDGCTDPGFYLSGSVLYLRSFNSDIDEFEGEWDPGVRGSVGWESPSGLFFDLTGFYHETDYTGDSGVVTGDFKFFYLDATVGDNLHCGELCVSVSGGLRYAHFEFNEDWGGMPNDSEFDGIGPVFNIEATRALSDRFGFYANIRQSLLFGESDFLGFTADTLASVTEIGAGVQLDFGLGMFSDAFLRAGFEGQYWHVDSASVGLLGGVLSLGANF